MKKGQEKRRLQTNYYANKNRFAKNYEMVKITKSILKKNKRFENFTKVVVEMLDEKEMQSLRKFLTMPRNCGSNDVSGKLIKTFSDIDKF